MNNKKPGVTNSYFLFRFIHFSFNIFLRQRYCVGVNKKLFMLVNSQLVSLGASSTRALSCPPAPVPPGTLASYQLVNYCSLRVKRRCGWRIREKGTGIGERGKGITFGFFYLSPRLLATCLLVNWGKSIRCSNITWRAINNEYLVHNCLRFNSRKKC